MQGVSVAFLQQCDREVFYGYGLAMDSLAIIILAAGNSARFGAANKLLAQLGGRPMIDHVLGLGEGFEHRFAVVQDGPVRVHAMKAGFSPVINPRPDLGQGGSIALGAKAALDSGVDTALFVLGDMPFVTRDYIAEFMAASASETMASIFGGQFMPPMIFAKADLVRLADLQLGAKGKDILGANVRTFDLPPEMARDIDQREDLAAISQRK